MKKHLIPENGYFYKANLHCHTTISDGNKTPEQDMGYSIVAYTDHDILIPHNELLQMINFLHYMVSRLK